MENTANNLFELPPDPRPEKGRISKARMVTHEEYMRYINAWTLRELVDMNQNLGSVKRWVTFFGILAVLGVIVNILF